MVYCWFGNASYVQSELLEKGRKPGGVLDNPTASPGTLLRDGFFKQRWTVRGALEEAVGLRR